MNKWKFYGQTAARYGPGLFWQVILFFCVFELMHSLVYLLLGSKAYCKAEDSLLDEDGESSSNEDYFGDLEDDGENPVNKKQKRKAEKEPNHALVEFVDEVCTTVMPADHVLCDNLALLKENKK